MPNPIDRVRPGADVFFAPGDLVRHRPQMALMVIDTLTRWAYAESAIGSCLTAILKSEAKPVISEFIQRANTTGQRKILLTHAKERLQAEDLETLGVLLSLFEDDFSERNKLAHGLSGYSPEIQDGMALMNPREMWHYEAAVYEYMTGLDRPASEPMGTAPDFDRSRVFIYVGRDFERINASMAELQRAFFWFRWILDHQKGGVIIGDRERGRVLGYDQLRSLPRFLPRLERLRADQSTAQAAPESQSLVARLGQWLLHARRFLARVFLGRT